MTEHEAYAKVIADPDIELLTDDGLTFLRCYLSDHMYCILRHKPTKAQTAAFFPPGVRNSARVSLLRRKAELWAAQGYPDERRFWE